MPGAFRGLRLNRTELCLNFCPSLSGLSGWLGSRTGCSYCWSIGGSCHNWCRRWQWTDKWRQLLEEPRHWLMETWRHWQMFMLNLTCNLYLGMGGSRDLREWRAVPRSWVSTYSQVRGCSLWKREIQHGCHLVQPAYVGSAGTGAHVEARGGCQESHAHILCLSPGDRVPLILELG